MKPETKVTNMSSVLVTAVLILLLISMIAGYIYYGMYYAKNATDPAVTGEAPVSTESDALAARRAEIITALNLKSASTMSAEEEASITSSLSQQSAPVESEEVKNKRAAIIEALQKQ